MNQYEAYTTENVSMQEKEFSYPKNVVRWQEILAVLFTWLGVLVYCLRAKTSRKRKVGVSIAALAFGLIMIGVTRTNTLTGNSTQSPSSDDSSSSPLESLNKDRFITSEAWNSSHNKTVVERSIKQSFRIQLTGAPKAVASASCDAGSQENIWICKLRFLGGQESIVYRMEANPETGQIAGSPMP